MMQLRDIEKKLSEELPALRNRFSVKKIGIFGSAVRGCTTDKSDIDILVEFSKTPDMIQFYRLETHLEALLGAKVDLVTRRALKPRIGERILSEVFYI